MTWRYIGTERQVVEGGEPLQAAAENAPWLQNEVTVRTISPARALPARQKAGAPHTPMRPVSPAPLGPPVSQAKTDVPQLLAWFAAGVAGDQTAQLRFSSSLNKDDRAFVHKWVQRVVGVTDCECRIAVGAGHICCIGVGMGIIPNELP